jgi:cytochrome bd-type quinol oxidase subunit 2
MCWRSRTSRGRSSGGKPAAAFVSSSFNIFAYVFLLVTALWPNIAVASDPA